MNGDTGFSLIYVALLMVLVGSGLAAYRLSPGKMLRMACMWIAIFAVAFLLALIFQKLFLEDTNPPIEVPEGFGSSNVA